MNTLKKPTRQLMVAILATFCMYECLCDFGVDDGRGCGPTPCKTTEDCPQDQFCCGDNYCHECCTDSHCPENQHCCSDYCRECCQDSHCGEFPEAYCKGYQCYVTCPTEGSYCQPETFDCCSWLVCDQFLDECIPPCENDEDCHDRIMRHAEDLKCSGGICDFEHCTNDYNCPGGKICFDGNCLTPLDCDQLAHCRVKPASSVVREGASIQLSAAAFLRNSESTPVLGFEWSTSDQAIAAVDSNGVVTGGSSDGIAVITAKVLGCETTCESFVANYTAATGTRVVVVDEFSGAPIQGATVVLGAEIPTSTDADGVATFATSVSPGTPVDITVSHSEYEYITLKNVESGDVIVYLAQICNVEKAGGITGKFDFSRILCKQGEDCPVRMGVAGLSRPGNLMNMDFMDLAVTVPCIPTEPGPNPPMPAGLQLCQNGDCTQEFYSIDGVPGLRVAWGLGGRLSLGDLIEILQPILSGLDENHLPSLYAGLIALYSKFYSSLVPDVEIVPEEHKRLDMQLNAPMSKTMTITPPALPVGVYDAVFVYSAAEVRDAGLVLLGTAAGIDSKDSDDSPDGVIEDPVILPAPDLSGRLPDSHIQRVVIALALNTSEIEASSSFSVQVLFMDTFEGEYQLDPFLLPADATYDSAGRHLEINQAPVTDYYQATFNDENNTRWHVMRKDAVSFDLPAAPSEGDRASTAALLCIDLKDGITYDDLPEFNDTNLINLIEYVEAFSFTEAP